MERLGKTEESLAETMSDNETEKTMNEMKAQAAYTNECLCQYREESDLKYQKLNAELSGLKIVKEFWLSSACKEGPEIDAEGVMGQE